MGKKSVAIIGGGLVGLSLGYKLSLRSDYKITVFEKESVVGKHQSGNNSGVLHCGLNYTPGSLKAKLANDGIKQMTQFCIENDVEHDICGKIVVATNDKEVKILDEIAEKGKRNGLQGLKYLDRKESVKREPYVNAEKSLLVPEEGIIDFNSVMNKLSDKIQLAGHEVIFNSKIDKVNSVRGKSIIQRGERELEFDLLINCSGLYSDLTYKYLTRNKRPLHIIPFRGEYMSIKDEYKDLVNHLIYPVPDPDFPFLGVHFTRLTNGAREVGPNAVFALKREGYSIKDFSLKETMDSVMYKGFLNFILKNFSFTMNEFRGSLSSRLFLKRAQTLVPDIRSNMIEKGTSGVRAQAMDKQGTLIMDFRIERFENQIHVLNAPSPGATSALSIADYIIDNYILN
ncbi:MAG: L-2-hydroxyglutarate oxidase [Bacteroidetes bacterium]|nr:MAG: L-2-hydroxyglutarate oxidase [Bacteroidota bacterium]